MTADTALGTLQPRDGYFGAALGDIEVHLYAGEGRAAALAERVHRIVSDLDDLPLRVAAGLAAGLPPDRADAVDIRQAEDGGPGACTISAAEFVRRVQLDRITARDGAEHVDLGYDDNAMFGGDWIVAEVDGAGRLVGTAVRRRPPPPATGEPGAVLVTTALGDLVGGNGRWISSGGEGDGLAFELEVGGDGPERVVALADRVHRIIGDRTGFVRRVRAELAAMFAPGDGWVDIWQGEDGGSGECRIPAGEFARRIRPVAVTATDDDFDGIDLWCDDNRMFGRHSIQARIDDTGTLVDARI
jgi:hypothetical protein